MNNFFFTAILFIGTFLFSENVPPGAFSITRIHYGGGGDWYSDPSSLPNLLEFLGTNTLVAVNPLEKRVKNGDDIFVEASGGINIENIHPYLDTGINAISIGALTHQAISKDIRLEFIS